MSVNPESVYYQHSGKISIASRLSLQARRRMFERFMQVARPESTSRVLDIGVTSDMTYKESNFFEQFYPYPNQIVCVGTEDGSHLETQYPGLRFIQVTPGKPLPFSDHEFDIVFSNAVIEHVGGLAEQKTFADEARRVGSKIFLTTPNRWFPVEHHTSVPLLHYLPKPIYRALIRRTPFRYWADEQHLNLLTYRSFAALFPQDGSIVSERIGLGVGVFKSNLIAFTKP